MRYIQNKIDEFTSEIPKTLITTVLKEKFEKEKIDYNDDIINQISSHIISGNGTPFQWGDDNDNRSISFSEEDMARVLMLADRISNAMPDIIEAQVDKATDMLLGELETKWSDEYQQQIDEKA